MTVQDASTLLTLVQNKWTLNIVTLTSVNGTLTEKLNVAYEDQEDITNGGFENGTTGWATGLTASISIVEAHTGTHSLRFNQSEQAYQYFGTPILVDSIDSFSFYVWLQDTYSTLFLKIHYTDSSVQQFGWGSEDFTVQTWSNVNVLGEGLSVGKSIDYIEFFSGSESDPLYIDDVSIQVSIQPAVKLQLDEFDPDFPDFQILFVNRPERIMYVAPNVIKHEQDILIQIYTKLVKYNQDDIEGIWRPLIQDMKGELTRIFNANRFDVQPNQVSPIVGSGLTGVVLNHSRWVDSKFPHGLGDETEPIIFITSMTVQIHYYEVVSGDSSQIGLRVASVQIISNDLLGVSDISWDDTDPWVMLQVPKGPLLEQHLLGPHLSGTIRCHDWNSIYNCLYNTPIPENTTQRPVNPDNSKTVFSTTAPISSEFKVYIEDVLGNISEFDFFNVRIQQVKMLRATTTGVGVIEWEIKWMSDFVYAVPPT